VGGSLNHAGLGVRWLPPDRPLPCSPCLLLDLFKLDKVAVMVSKTFVVSLFCCCNCVCNARISGLPAGWYWLVTRSAFRVLLALSMSVKGVKESLEVWYCRCQSLISRLSGCNGCSIAVER